jgi:hypothetical protein
MASKDRRGNDYLPAQGASLSISEQTPVAPGESLCVFNPPECANEPLARWRRGLAPRLTMLLHPNGYRAATERPRPAPESRRSQKQLERRLLAPGQFGGVSVPADCPADLAFGGSGHADTTNSCPAHSASCGDFRGHAVELRKRRGRHGLRRRREGQGKGHSYHFNHRLSPFYPQTLLRIASTPRNKLIHISDGDRHTCLHCVVMLQTPRASRQ